MATRYVTAGHPAKAARFDAACHATILALSCTLLINVAFAQETAPSDSFNAVVDQVEHGDASVAVAEATPPPSCAQTPSAEIPAEWSHWNWVPSSALTGNCAVGTGCDGAYVEPIADWPDAGLKPDGIAIRASAQRSELQGDILTMTGNVVLSQGYRRVSAEQIVVDRSSGNMQVPGPFEIREPGLLVRGNKTAMTQEGGLGSINTMQMLQYDTGVRMEADFAKRVSQWRFEMDNAFYTQCSPDDQVWALRASDLDLDYQTGFGTAKHARVEVLDVPVFYTPWLQFPVDDRRMTGLLWPTLASSSEGGFELAQPIYLNLAPNYDATLLPRWIEERGTMVEAEARYLNPYGNWLTAGSLLDKDETIDEKRWMGHLGHNGAIGMNWRTLIDYSKVSDNDYFRDLSTNLGVRRQSHLNQHASTSYLDEVFIATLTAQDYQTIDDFLQKPYRVIPQFTVMDRSGSENFAPDWLFRAQYSRFDHDESIEKGGSFQTGERAYLHGGASFPMRWAPGFVIPTAKLRHLDYQLDDTGVAGTGEAPSTSTVTGALDMGLVFERETHWADRDYTQTLEPRAYYLYSDYEDQSGNPLFDTSEMDFSFSQLFRDTRFAGYDRLDDANQLSTALTSRFIDAERGYETFIASIGQITYFQDRRVVANNIAPEELDRNDSAIAGELMYQPGENLWASTSMLWDPFDDAFEEGGASVHYRRDARELYNLGYRYRREGKRFVGLEPIDIDQADASLIYPLNNSWGLYSRFQYDLGDNRALENTAGVSYENCCWMLRLVYQKAVLDEYADMDELVVEYDERVVLEFQLKGLGSLGNQAQDILQESIFGYQ